MPTPFNPKDWYWIVGGDETRFYSSAARDYVQKLPAGAGVTRILNEDELWDVLRQQAPECLPEWIEKPKSLEQRLQYAEALVAVAIEKGLVSATEVDGALAQRALRSGDH